jgi:hypothetical protein
VYTKVADVPVSGFWKFWTQKLASLKSECHAVTNQYPEAASVVQQVYKIFSDIENLARCTLAKVGGKLLVDLYCEYCRSKQNKLLQRSRWEAAF